MNPEIHEAYSVESQTGIMVATLKIRFADVTSPKQEPSSWASRAARHPFFAWTGLRPLIAQHTLAEHQAMEKYARGRKNLVEIGVAEGASAVALRTVMNAEGTLFLVDPFHLSRVRLLNFLRRAARRAVSAHSGAKTVWIEAFSHEAVGGWNRPIDFLLIDGDHRESAVEQDWKDWTPHVVEDGVVVFHDARIFTNGWTSADYGPVRFVDRTFRNSSSDWMILDEIDSLVVVSRKGHTANAHSGDPRGEIA
jgi:predicted O-methyltransferase YrrM